jgi:predicted small secreted protein
MKTFSRFILIIGFFVGFMTLLPSCKTKEGCGQEEMYNNPDMESTKRGKSNLFSKSQNKRMKKKSK